MKNIGIIGFGYWGPNIAKNLFLNPKVNLKWVCDRNINRLEKAKIAYKSQVNYSQDSDEILNDSSLDGIAIAVETAGHYNLVKQSLLKKHVFLRFLLQRMMKQLSYARSLIITIKNSY